MIVVTDNCRSKEIEEGYLDDLQLVGNKSISNLIQSSNHNELLVFPDSLEENHDQIKGEVIFNLDKNIMSTGNIMGFIGINNTDLKIESRFSQNSEDYFLYYMLEKVMSINLFNLKTTVRNTNKIDLLIYLFPYFLKKALNQGLYKEYKQASYNDANVKGSIDFNRHLKSNIPFSGKVAYKIREHSFDNNLTQLIRHTLEFIKQKKHLSHILSNDEETRDYVNQITQHTPSFNLRDRRSVINANRKRFSHPYFHEYLPLQKICLQILRHDGLKYNTSKDKAFGVLFDGAWLWEEYLNTILKECDFLHPENKTGKDVIYLFQNNRGKRYPDFYKKDVVLDAKYKRLLKYSVDRNDMNQIISYMYILKSNIGGFVVPIDNSEKNSSKFLGKLNGNGGEVFIYGLAIPKNSINYKHFKNEIKLNEINIKNSISKIETND